MALSRREILTQVQGLIDAEKRVEARTGAIAEEELDLRGFIEEAEEDSPGQMAIPTPSGIPGIATSRLGLSAGGPGPAP